MNKTEGALPRMKKVLLVLSALSLNLPTALASVSNTVVCTKEKIPCVAIDAPLERGSAFDEDPDLVVVYTSSKGARKGSKFLKRSTQHIEDHHNGGWQKIYTKSDQDGRLVLSPLRPHPVLGFGGAFTDSATMVLSSLDKSLQSDFIRSHFSASDGIGYSLGRVPMAATDFSCRRHDTKRPAVRECSTNSADYYTYADVESDTLSNFHLAPEDEEHKIPHIKEAMAEARRSGGDLKLFSSPWSAPAWMKENHPDTKAGTPVSLVHGKLKSDAKTQSLWAEYFVKFFSAYQERGVEFWGTTLENEPQRDGFLGMKELQTWQSMYFTPQEEAAFLKVLGPRLAAASSKGFDKIKIMIHDDQTPKLLDRVLPILSDEDAAKYIDGVGIHWYMSGKKTYPNIAKALGSLQKTYTQDGEPFVLSTEACNGYMPFGTKFPGTGWLAGRHRGGPYLGNWARGEMYARDIMGAMSQGSSGWTDWSMALNMQGGPTWAKNYVDAPVLIDAERGRYYLQPMFFFLGHFSKFIRPGAQLLDIDSVGAVILPDLTKMEAIAFRVPAYSVIGTKGPLNMPATNVFVVMNTDPVSGRKYFISLPHGKFINMDIGANSIQTIVFADAKQRYPTDPEQTHLDAMEL